MPVPVKRHRGEPGHTKGHARDTRERTGTRITQTNLTTSKATNTQPARQRDDRNRGQLNSRCPGADRSPRPTQKRPPARAGPPAGNDPVPDPGPRHSRLPPPRHPLPERLPVRVIPVPVRVFEPPASKPITLLQTYVIQAPFSSHAFPSAESPTDHPCAPRARHRHHPRLAQSY